MGASTGFDTYPEQTPSRAKRPAVRCAYGG
jgi:hypothetical protein